VVLTIHVQPGASREGPAGTHDGLPRLRVRARAHDGEANREVVKAVAKLMGVPRTSVRIASGERSRTKRIEVTGDPGGLALAAGALFDQG
jgi:uncharacterized protein (TIGR00251 family)